MDPVRTQKIDLYYKPIESGMTFQLLINYRQESKF